MMANPGTQKDDAEYVLLTSADGSGNLASITENTSFLRVAIARPRHGSLTERILDEAKDYPMRDMQAAVIDFFDRMRASGMTGVLDSPEVRLFQKTPLDFCQAMTDHIWDQIDEEIDEDDERVDDFENHPLSALREAMVDASPEFGGGDALEAGV